MSKRTKVKGYWQKRKETFDLMSAAQERAGVLRAHGRGNTGHVKVSPTDDGRFSVGYSVSQEFVDQAKMSGISI